MALLTTKRSGRWILALCLACTGAWQRTAAQIAAVSRSAPAETSVKAAFLLSFAAFIEWPERSFSSPSTPLRLCVYGQDPFADMLEKVLAGERVDGRSFEIVRVASGQPVPDCHMLFIADSEASRVQHVLAMVGDRPIVTFANLERFVELGGMVQFITRRGRVRFHINTEAGKRANISFSSKLLRLADPV